MAVMDQKKLVRNDGLVISRQTSVAGSSGLVDAIFQAPALVRAMGGSTIEESSEGTAKFDVCDRVGFLVGWLCTQLSTQTAYVRIHGGDAWQGDLGNVDISLTPTATGTTAATVTKIVAGPFESARFALKATSTDVGVGVGENYIKFSLVTDGATAGQAKYVNIAPFRWPDVQYAT
jgi:hypothetical protein